jgi:hypothetical protein
MLILVRVRHCMPMGPDELNKVRMVRVLGDLVNAGAGSEKAPGMMHALEPGSRRLTANYAGFRQCICMKKTRLRDGMSRECATERKQQWNRQHERVGEERGEAKEHRTHILYSAKRVSCLSNGFVIVH